MTLELIIGNKNTSSWSMRPWVLMRQFDIPFTETLVRLDDPKSRATLGDHSPSGLVPCLKDDGVVVWDSLAIAEYLAEKFADRQLWPADPVARARARCLASEMHAGFSNLRTIWPMDLATHQAGVTTPPLVRRDLARIFDLWEGARTDFAQEGAGQGDGPFLFGAFSIADAFYAPVVSRIRSFGPVPTSPVVSAYMDAMWASPAMTAWAKDAAAEVAAGWYA